MSKNRCTKLIALNGLLNHDSTEIIEVANGYGLSQKEHYSLSNSASGYIMQSLAGVEQFKLYQQLVMLHTWKLTSKFTKLTVVRPVASYVIEHKAKFVVEKLEKHMRCSTKSEIVVNNGGFTIGNSTSEWALRVFAAPSESTIASGLVALNYTVYVEFQLRGSLLRDAITTLDNFAIADSIIGYEHYLSYLEFIWHKAVNTLIAANYFNLVNVTFEKFSRVRDVAIPKDLGGLAEKLIPKIVDEYKATGYNWADYIASEVASRLQSQKD